MLAQLSTLKSRLGIAEADTQFDPLLTGALQAISAVFDKEARRRFARTVDIAQEFSANDTEIVLSCYPLESVSSFELKTSEAEGWVEQVPDYLVRGGCIVSLLKPLGTARQLARITYTGGYILPGDVPSPPAPLAVSLPADLEHAATEQAAAFFQNRDKLGLIRHWPNSGTYAILSQQPLLPKVAAILRRYERWQP